MLAKIWTHFFCCQVFEIKLGNFQLFLPFRKFLGAVYSFIAYSPNAKVEALNFDKIRSSKSQNRRNQK